MTIWKKQRGAVAFQSTPPARGATAENGSNNGLKLFQSTPPARGATRRGTGQLQVLDISIHAPREGGDCGVLQRTHWLLYFNPRPREGGDMLLQPLLQPQNGISIHSPREGGDRSDGNGPVAPGGDFNPRPPRGGRPARAVKTTIKAISIHAPREGGDGCLMHLYPESV